MRAWQIGSRCGIDGMKLAERPEPEPGPDDIRVRVLAAGLNYRDLMVLNGAYGKDLPVTRVPLSDGVGIVDAIGDNVTALAPGMRVIAPHFLRWIDGPYRPAAFAADLGVTADGWLADTIVLPAAAAIVVAPDVDDATAATLAVAGSTVWHAMVAFGGAGAGQLILAQGTGGVSIFALLLAKALGASFAITSSSHEKLKKARSLGADFAVNYREHHDWPAALRASTDGRGADVIVDTLGFSALGSAVEAAAVGARIGTVGALSGSPADAAGASQGAIIGKNITIKGIASGSRVMLVAALDVVARHKIMVPIDREFAFNDAQPAYRHLAAGAQFGKVLIRID